jgi:hypothetical protein
MALLLDIYEKELLTVLKKFRKGGMLNVVVKFISLSTEPRS